jgi:hypothetical protein
MNVDEIGWEVAAWIYLAQDREQWRALVSTVIYFHVPQKEGDFFNC